MNFGNDFAEIQQKYDRKREKVGERNFLFLAIPSPKFFLPIPVARVGARSVEGSQKKPIAAMLLPKMGGEKKLEWNCGNGITENK